MIVVEYSQDGHWSSSCSAQPRSADQAGRLHSAQLLRQAHLLVAVHGRAAALGTLALVQLKRGTSGDVENLCRCLCRVGVFWRVAIDVRLGRDRLVMLGGSGLVGRAQPKGGGGQH